MVSILHGQRVLLLTVPPMRSLLRSALPADWVAVETGSIEQGTFVQQQHPCDVAVLDGALVDHACEDKLLRLTEYVPGPVVLAAEPAAAHRGLSKGMIWVPNEVVGRHPELYARIVEQAARLGQQRLQADEIARRLRESQAHVDRLLELLWQTVPGEGPARWLSQRHMLERLDEEVARTRRHGGSMSLILGEFCPEEGKRIEPAHFPRLAQWIAERISKHKRRCDVAGQYGPMGFMLLMPRVGGKEAIGACQRLARVLAHPTHEPLVGVHLRFGVASVPDEQPCVLGLLRRAEEQLGQASEAVLTCS